MQIKQQLYSLQMKQKKRIIDHIIEYSRPSTIPIQSSNPPLSQRGLNSDNSLELDGHINIESNDTKFSEELQPSFCFQVCIEIGDGRSECICINQNSDPYKEAEKICHKYSLEEYIVALLADSLKEQIQKEKKMGRSMMDSHAFGKSKSIVGAEKLPSQNRTYRYNKHSQQLWKQSEQQQCRAPIINQVSSEIVKKMGGKQKIIDNVSKKFQEKQKQHMLEQIQNQQKQYEGYPFHPSIDPISRKVDETLHFSRNETYNIARYQHLYEQHRLIENKKQLKRRSSLMQIPFKPSINNVSRVIMNKKRSLGQFPPLSEGKQRINSTSKNKYQKSQSKQKKILKRRQSLNSSSWQLCHHLYQQAKKREQKLQKESQRIYNNANNWKIIENSNNLIYQLRENRIGEVFDSLVKPPYHELHCFNIDENKLDNVQKIFMPIIKEMREINASLNREEFVQAGLRLLKYMSPNQRALLIRRNGNSTNVDKENNNKDRVLSINKKSKQIMDQKGYGQKSIYMRGLMFRNEVKNQIEKGKEEKVRTELKGCTFKPKINSIPQNIAY